MSMALLFAVAAQLTVPPANAPADPLLVRATALYEDVCLKKFPDDAAIDAAMPAVGATPLSDSDTKVTLGDDPGRGWEIKDGNRSVLIFLELPPYHACSVRWPMPSDAVDLSLYDAAVARFTASHPGFTTMKPMVGDRGTIRIHATGLQRSLPDGDGESLFVIDQRTNDPARLKAGETGIMLRFVHQAYHAR